MQLETVKFYPTETEAAEVSKYYNRSHKVYKTDLMVVVEGPEDNWAVMPLRDAIDFEFSYSWYC